MDEQLVIETRRGALVGMLHRPERDARPEAAVLFCHAFGEERKSSALTMARLARAVAGAGLPALRFDYYGCGDSEGEFADATVASRLDDVPDAARFLQERTGAANVLLLGLRLGATLAALAAEGLPDCAGLVLIEPIMGGAAYFGRELRRRLVRRMMTDGRAEEAAEPAEDELLDLDGFAVRPATYRELRALGIRAGQVAFAGPVLVVQVHFKEGPKPELEAACNAYRQAGAPVAFRRLVLPPFWNRIEVILAPELDAAVTSWLCA
jgi:exosortase A-associated hydrolase 2